MAIQIFLTFVIRWIDLTDARRRRSCLTEAFLSPRTTASGNRCVMTCLRNFKINLNALFLAMDRREIIQLSTLSS